LLFTKVLGAPRTSSLSFRCNRHGLTKGSGASSCHWFVAVVERRQTTRSPRTSGCKGRPYMQIHLNSRPCRSPVLESRSKFFEKRIRTGWPKPSTRWSAAPDVSRPSAAPGAAPGAAPFPGSAQPEERQHRDHHDNQPDDVNDVVHAKSPLPPLHKHPACIARFERGRVKKDFARRRARMRRRHLGLTASTAPQSPPIHAHHGRLPRPAVRGPARVTAVATSARAAVGTTPEIAAAQTGEPPARAAR